VSAVALSIEIGLLKLNSTGVHKNHRISRKNFETDPHRGSQNHKNHKKECDTMGMLPKGLIPGPEEIEKIKAGFKEFAREIDDIHEQVSNINEKVDKILEAIEKLKLESQAIDKKE